MNGNSECEFQLNMLNWRHQSKDQKPITSCFGPNSSMVLKASVKISTNELNDARRNLASTASKRLNQQNIQTMSVKSNRGFLRPSGMARQFIPDCLYDAQAKLSSLDTLALQCFGLQKDNWKRNNNSPNSMQREMHIKLDSPSRVIFWAITFCNGVII